MSNKVIQAKNIKKSFGNQVVHNGISFSVIEGETTIIVGPSGVGKSLLLKFILGLMEPDEGDILIDGKNIAQMSRKELLKTRSKLGVVFQRGCLI